MMDDRGEHCGRRTHSSVGGIYRSNRTVSTCPCHLMESVGVGACLRILTCVHWVVFPQPSEMSGWKCFVCKYSLAVYGKACFLLRFSLTIYIVQFLPCAVCLQLLVIPLGLRCVRGNMRLFKVSSLISIAVVLTTFLLLLFGRISSTLERETERCESQKRKSLKIRITRAG